MFLLSKEGGKDEIMAGKIQELSQWTKKTVH